MTPTSSTEAIGVWQDAAGNFGSRLEDIVVKVQEVHAHLATSPLPLHLTCIGLKQAVWRYIAYVLPAASLNVKDYKLLAKELYCPLLPKIGCNCNFPLLLRYNPSLLLGLDLYDPNIEQGISKIELLLKLLRNLYEQHQLKVGLLTPFFILPCDTYSVLTPAS